jgi:hypothetical protein
MTAMIDIRIDGGRSAFHPGEVLAGETAWLLDRHPESVELRLFWFTRGRGTEDVEVVQRLAFANPAQEDRRSFQLRLPESPYSFSGRLISLTWAIEVVASPGRRTGRAELVLSPSLSEIVLHP